MNADWKRYATITRSAPLRLALLLTNPFTRGPATRRMHYAPWRKLRWLACFHSAGSTANVERMPHVTVLTGFRGDARDSPPDGGMHAFWRQPVSGGKVLGPPGGILFNAQWAMAQSRKGTSN